MQSNSIWEVNVPNNKKFNHYRSSDKAQPNWQIKGPNWSIYNENNIGPRIDPWGTPQLKGVQVETPPLADTKKVCSDK